MLKITTKRDRREEEALRDEGREEARDEQYQRTMASIMASEYVERVDLFDAGDLKPGDVFCGYIAPRVFYRQAIVVEVADHDPHGNPVRPGELGVSYTPCPGSNNSGWSLMRESDQVLLEVKP